MILEIILLGGCSTVLVTLFLRKTFGFQAQKPTDYLSKGPQFDIRKNLSGPMLSEGIIYGPFGRVTSRFVAKMHAEWNGDVGEITEVFDYDSGNSQTCHPGPSVIRWCVCLSCLFRFRFIFLYVFACIIPV